MGYQRYKNSENFYAIGLRIENKRFGMANFITHMGVKYNNDDWKKTGAQMVREYIAFHIDNNGYFGELNRSISGKEWLGLGYVANTLVNVAEIAHILYHDGYANLFDFKTKTTFDRNSGAIIQGSVEKDLEWMMLKIRKNFMLDNSPAIYRLKSKSN